MEIKRGGLFVSALVVLLIAGFLLSLNQWNVLQLERRRLLEEEQLFSAAKARLAGLQALERQSAQLDADWEVVEQLLPTSPRVEDLLLDFQAGADLAEMNFGQIRFAEQMNVEGAEGLVEMPMQLLFEGSYHQLMNFLDYLLLYERAIRIDELRLSQNPDGMTVNMSASAFYAAE
ncbi:MAG: type 4a pilus biogenesis protein PilO [Firmicutes bacterium]|jgi:Tfp pilus assembly protein PilO|nr:type 4a pilus biogenesis protein PilO [Bacillota bacterium]MCL5993061.1 type 4a pilus biogenesis protein PilO [Bacillota bacterium]